MYIRSKCFRSGGGGGMTPCLMWHSRMGFRVGAPPPLMKEGKQMALCTQSICCHKVWKGVSGVWPAATVFTPQCDMKKDKGTSSLVFVFFLDSNIYLLICFLHGVVRMWEQPDAVHPPVQQGEVIMSSTCKVHSCAWSFQVWGERSRDAESFGSTS